MVTGASRGIGRAVAVDLSRAGFEVVAAMRDPTVGADLAHEVGGGPGSITPVRIDLDDASTFAVPPNIAVLVNNAGIEPDYLPVEHTSIEDWRAVFETNVFGLVELTRRAIPVMRSAGRGVIVNVTSSSVLAAIPFYAVYRASKAAVSAFSETLRVEVAPFGIRVVEILPGPVESDMLRHSDRRYEAADHAGYEDMAAASRAGRQAIDSMITLAAEAADRIRAAILDDDAALKQGCDDLGTDLLAAWSTGPLAMVDPTVIRP